MFAIKLHSNGYCDIFVHGEKAVTMNKDATFAIMPLLEQAVGKSPIPTRKRINIDYTHGYRLACYAAVVSGLRNSRYIANAARHIQQAEPYGLCWWWQQMTSVDAETASRAKRALRVLVEASGDC